MNFNNKNIYTSQPEYDKNFWNAMRGKDISYASLSDGLINQTGTYTMPGTTNNKYEAAIAEQSLFRKIATTFKIYDGPYHILAKDYDDLAQFVPENGTIPIYDGQDDFTQYSIDSNKLAVFLKLNADFVRDSAFDIEKHLVKRMATNFAGAEDSVFISGTGEQMPVGILNATNGAEAAQTVAAITYDDVINLYFSVDKKYRKNGVWMMNDETAYTLRTLKDTAGNYLWRDSDNTILDKKVEISEYMPSISAGNKPIAFGDFSYYHIIERKPVSVKTLTEKFALYYQIGYLAFEFIDGKLIRPDAIKVIQMSS